MSLPRPKSSGVQALRDRERSEREESRRARSATGALNYGSVDGGRVLTPTGVIASEPPPKPEPPTVLAGVESFSVVWSGSAERQIPADFARVAVHASKISGYFPTAGTDVASITSPDGGSVVIQGDAGDTYYVRLQMVTLKGLVSDPTTEVAVVPEEPAAPTSDGLAPASSPTPTVIGGIGAIHVRWPAAVNADPVTYEVHVSTASGFTPDAGTLFVATAGASTTIRTLPDASPLAYGTTYFVKLIATDADGAAAASAQGSAQLFKIETVDIQAGAVVTASIGNNAVDTSKLADGSVSAAKIIDGSVGSAEIAADAVTSTEIADDAVTTPKIVANAVTAAEIAANTITAGQIAASAIGVDELAANSVVAGKIAANAVTTTTLAAGAVTADKVAANSITSNEIAADYVYAGNIIVDQLLGGSLSADVLLSSTITTRPGGVGGGVDISNPGIDIYDSAGIPATVLHSEGSTFKGDAELAGLTVTGGMALRSAANEVSESGSLTLAQGTTASQSTPTAVVGWESVNIQTDSGVGLVLHAGAWHNVRASDPPAIWSFPVAGGAGTLVTNLGPAGDGLAPSGLTRIGSSWYTISLQLGPGDHTITKWSDTGVEQASEPYTSIAFSGGATIGNDGTNVLICEFDPANERYRIQVRNASTLALSFTQITSSHSNFTGRITGVLQANFDFGATRTIISTFNQPDCLAFDGTPTLVGDDGFPLPSTGVIGLAWDGSNFYTAKVVGDSLTSVTKHTAIKWTSESAKWWAGYTWRDSDATGGTHETNLSPKASFTMKKRARVTLTTPTIPDTGDTDDPDSVRVYLGRGAIEPVISTMWLNGTPAAGVNTTIVTAPVFSGTNPPSTNNFPGATPGKIVSAQLNGSSVPQFEVKGDGSGRWGDLEVSAAGDVSGVSGERIATSIVSADGAAVTGTEASVATVAAAVVAGRLYRVTFDFGFAVSASTGQFLGRIREDSLTGTEIQIRRLMGQVSGGTFFPGRFETEFTATLTTSKTFVVTFQRSGGSTETITLNATAGRPSFLYVDYIR